MPDDAHYLTLLPRPFSQRRNSYCLLGQHQIRHEFREWHKRECTFSHTRVWDDEIGGIEVQLAIK